VDSAVLTLYCCAKFVRIESETLQLLLAVPATFKFEVVKERCRGVIFREEGDSIPTKLDFTLLMDGGKVALACPQRPAGVTLLVLVVIRLSIDVQHAAFAFTGIRWGFVDRLKRAVMAVALIRSSYW
jgi:hypothetical protein